MVEGWTVTFKELAAKKVVGVPVLYLAAAAVIVLAIVAWRMKPSPEPKDPTDQEALGDAEIDPETGLAVPGNPYAGLSSNGTVTVVQQPTNTTPEVDTISTNEEWAKAAAEWLTATLNVPGSQAIAALHKYLEGQDRSFQEEEWTNLAIKEKGQPPFAPVISGTVGNKPANKQITPPGYHTVTGPMDDTIGDIAKLYYNNTTDDTYDLLQAANPSIGDGTWAPGQKVFVPVYHAPIYYTVTASKGLTASEVASKNGISLVQLAKLNDPKGGAYNPAFRFLKNARVRVK